MHVASHLEVSSNPLQVGVLRRLALGDSLVQGLGEDVRSDLILILSEAVSNAVVAAPPGSRIDVDIRLDEGVLVVEVSNEGTAEVRIPSDLPGPSEPRGRGLTIVRVLGGEISSTAVGGRTTVRIVVDTGRMWGCSAAAPDRA